MKLTQTHKDAFVRAVLDDVPSMDYDEAARKIILTAAVEQLAPVLKAVWDDPQFRGELNSRYTYIEGFGVYIPGPKVVLSTRVLSKLRQLKEDKSAQSAARTELRNKVRSAIQACSTLKQAKDALPEFERYLPAEPGKTTNLPVVRDVVAELKKAGWPKGAKK